MNQTLKYALSGLALASSLSVGASTIVVDDFLGGPHVVMLTSLAPPQIAVSAAGFAHPGAIGGNRDAAVWSTTVGSFAAGVAFGSGGYASFSGRGQGAVVWDGVPGLADANADNTLDIDEVDLGLTLDLLANCENPNIEVTAFADLPGGALNILFLTDHSNYAVYTVPIVSGSFNPYSVAVDSPSSTTGVFDPTDVKAIALFVDGTAVPNLDVLVSRFVISCPDGGATLALMGAGLLGLATVRRHLAR
jgi:hypothetical protein